MTTSEPFSFQSASDAYGSVFRRTLTDNYTFSSNVKSLHEFAHGQVEYASLMPASRIATETSLTTLRQELQKAHQLLAQQQGQIRDLIEQSDSRELQLQQAQQEVETLRQSCDRQSTQIVEMQTIACDLKMQLKRQQQRVLQYRTLLEQAQDQPLFVNSLSTECRDAYSTSEHPSRNRNESPSKLQVNEEWLVQRTQQLMGPAVAQRKLLTLGLTPSVAVVESEQQISTLTKLYENITLASTATTLIQGTPATQASKFEVDLPCFTKSHH
jgi:DNA repair exonuclease SbcCD ATPase subunit